MHIQFKKHGCYKKAVRKYLFLFACSLFVLFFGVLSASAELDLLKRPSVKTGKASSALLTDVTKAGTRLVAVGERGYIIYSDNNGKSWTQADVPVQVTLTAVNFPSDEKGWAVGHDSVVLHSENAGQTWTKQIDGEKINEFVVAQLKQMIQSQKRKLETAEAKLEKDQSDSAGDSLADVQEDLENLGFALIGAEEALAEGPTRPLMDLWFKNNREGIVIGTFGLILGTTDGGESWSPLMDRMDNPEGYHYYGIDRSGNDLFIAGEFGLLFRSPDFGATWERLDSPYDGSFFGITGSSDGGNVTAFGLRGSVFSSQDRGGTWMKADRTGNAAIIGGTMLSDGVLCIAGVDGTVHCNMKGEKIYHSLPTGFPGIISLTGAPDGALVLVGLRGALRMEICNIWEEGN